MTSHDNFESIFPKEKILQVKSYTTFKINIFKKLVKHKKSEFASKWMQLTASRLTSMFFEIEFAM